jgi:hypothetical protein
MPDESQLPDELPDLSPDFLYEDRHEFVEKLAYKFWIQRGRPLGSPSVDWHAAEQALYASLVASGMISPSSTGTQNIGEEIYRRKKLGELTGIESAEI